VLTLVVEPEALAFEFLLDAAFLTQPVPLDTLSLFLLRELLLVIGSQF